MSKRRAETDLNHENWDDDDPRENSKDKETGTGFKMASRSILENRVIRTAKRRSQATGNEAKKSVFGNFSGFMKPQPTSFDFLSKVTNGNGNNDNNASTTKMDSPATSSLFTGIKPVASPTAGVFASPTSSNTPSTSPFASTQMNTSSIFGVSSTNTNPTSNIFSNTKADSTGDTPFKMQTVTSTTDVTDISKSTATTSLASATKFVTSPSNSNVAKSLFSNATTSSSFKSQTTSVKTDFGMKTKSQSITETEKISEASENNSEIKYYSKLKGLNESVSDWIKKHVEQTPLCILTPIFKDYEKYLKDIQDEYQTKGKENKKDDNKIDDTKISAKVTKTNTVTGGTGLSLFNMPQSTTSVFTSPKNSTGGENKSATFSFGINASSTSTSSTITTSSPEFKFGVSTASSQSTTSITSPFSSGPTTSFSFAASPNTSGTNSNGSTAPFSFGTGKPFSFSNVKQKTETTAENTAEDEDAPPKVDYTPVVEENSVYDKKCKIFVKKEGNFVDKGVGTLYIKKVEQTGKHQLLVRANTNLGTILVNLILVSGIPTQRMGKNNVMMICIPTPESEPPPTPLLIRVKSSEEADELLSTLEKYKT